MVNKTKKRRNHCKKKTIKIRDVNEIITINKKFNNFSKENLTKTLQKTLVKEFKNRIILDCSTLPYKNNKYTYSYMINKNDNYGIYYYTDNITNKKNVLVNCQKMSKKSTYFHMNDLDISNDETYVAFSVDYNGNNISTLYLKNIDTGKQTIITTKTGNNYCISPDSKLLYYVISDTAGRPYKLYSYNINTHKSKLIYTERNLTTSIVIYKTSDNLKCLLDCLTKLYSNTFCIENNEYTHLFKHQTKKIYHVDHFLNKWYILVDDNYSRVVETTDFKSFTTVLKHMKNIKYEFFLLKANKLIVGSRYKGYNYLTIKNLCNNKIVKINLSPIRNEIKFPELANMNVFSNNLLINISTFLNPSKIVSINLNNFDVKELKSYKPSTYNPKLYVEKVIKVKDELFMTILYKKNNFKKNMKCLLSGYGSYGTVEDPLYDYSIQSLLDRGFIYCFAHIRGGGYMGKKWYDNGKLFKKMNSFYDFITCTEFLINNNYTSSDKLAIWGRSAGGLLIGAVLNMRPDLYKFAILGVPFVDVLSTMSDKCSPLTTEEYYEFGNPSDKKMYEYIKKYSPIDNINFKHNYPNVYIYSNINDNQVRYTEPFKYYNKIKNSSVFISGEKDLLMKINLKYGHRQSSKRFEMMNETAEIYNLILHFIQ